MPRPLFTLRKGPVPLVQEAGWTLGPVWTGAVILAPHRDSILGPFSPQPVAIPNTLPGPPYTNFIEHKMCVLIFTTTLSETFLVLRRIQRDIIVNIQKNLV